MSTTDLRREIKKAVDQVPAERLESLADYVQFLSRPSVEQRVKEAEDTIASGKGKNLRSSRNDRKAQSNDSTWEAAIFDLFASRPKHVWTLNEIYSRVETMPFVTAHHHEIAYGRPNYQHWVRSHLKKLKDAGKIRQVERAQYAMA
jgi:hypothetical protein